MTSAAPARHVGLTTALVLATIATFALLPGCRTGKPTPAPQPEPVTNVFHTAKLAELDATVLDAITNQRCPGGVLWIERRGTAYRRAYGNRALVPAIEPMTEDTLFDAASLTKVLACTPAILRLVEKNRVDLDAPVCRYLPEFTGDGRQTVTLRHLLTHTSGLRPDIGLQPDWNGTDAALRLACAEKLTATPGEKFVYSDTGPILLGEIVRRVSGLPLDQFLAREIYGPMRLADTGFNPPAAKRNRIAPTEIENGQPLRGVVHDPRARRMAGVAGHAGLFTTAADLARFCRMLLNGGQIDGIRIFQPESVRLMSSVQTPPRVSARRALGWDIDSPYAGQRGSVFPIGGFGHTGWTGTSVWIDPYSATFVIFLSNRNHPTESGNVIPLRRRIGTLAAESVIGFNFAFVPGALPPLATPTASATNNTSSITPTPLPAVNPAEPASPVPQPTNLPDVLNGIDVLARDGFKPLKGLRLGLITNHTGHDRQRHPTIDLLRAAPGVTLKVLFSPEHGIRGLLDEKVADGIDERSGLPVFSLYGETRQPSPAQLRDLDALVFDIQDIGCRFYTYISTLGLALEAAAKANIKVFVLDRPNPIGGATVDGPLYAGNPTFTAFHPIPIRHGMTVGELARLFNAERAFHCDLTVIPVAGWTRNRWFDQTGLPWTNPSPNMRSLTEATLYPGVGLLETTALSVGRGTGTPFELVGAPYIDDIALAADLNRAALPGVRFVPIRFTPTSSTFANKPCGGVHILLLDRERCNSFDVGLTIAQTLHRRYPTDFNLDKFNNLLQHPATLNALRAGTPPSAIRQSWANDLAAFRQRRTAALLYE
jgi:uncharacterized protein YbbC (DUF1343 family)/CubicO group peptidase (beta-lactamase class C family)